jgi:hypothetical protein
MSGSASSKENGIGSPSAISTMRDRQSVSPSMTCPDAEK